MGAMEKRTNPEGLTLHQVKGGNPSLQPIGQGTYAPNYSIFLIKMQLFLHNF